MTQYGKQWALLQWSRLVLQRHFENFEVVPSKLGEWRIEMMTVSNGGDTEVDRDGKEAFLADAVGENKPVELHD